MSEAKHTPGPWTYRAADAIHGSPQTYEALVYGRDNHNYVADVFGVTRNESSIPWEANARLIAAAPELLAHAKTVAFHLRRGDHKDPHAVQQMIDALEGIIAEAEGHALSHPNRGEST